MQYNNSAAIVGVFTDLNQARKAVQVLQDEQIGSSVRLVENDFNHGEKFDNNDNRMGASSSTSSSSSGGGISGFFARLFGFDDDRSDLRLNADSEMYFKDSYQKSHHIVVVENPQDVMRCRELLTSYGAVIEDRGIELYEQERFQTGREDLEDTQVMELSEEKLNVDKNRVQTGEVHLRKEIITEMKTVEIPLVREEIVIETRPLNGTARPGSINAMDAGESREIRIPVSEEQIHVEKTVVPREEVRVSKERVVEQRQVSEEVKREEAFLEEEGRVSISASDREKLKAKAKTKAPIPGASKYNADDIQPGI